LVQNGEIVFFIKSQERNAINTCCLGYDTVKFGGKFPTFWNNKHEDGDTIIL
jgi:hypothetical protein